MGIDIMQEKEEDDDFQSDLFKESATLNIKDITVCLFLKVVDFPSPELGRRNIHVTLHKYPYKDLDGGLIVISNPIAFVGTKRKYYPTRQLLNRAYKLIKQKTLSRNPDVVLLWDGPILRDSPDTIQRFV